jgi:type VI secretion system secreted protein Hcp
MNKQSGMVAANGFGRVLTHFTNPFRSIHMPTPCYISIEGKTQGNITASAFTSDSVGNIFVQGHEDEMLVQEFNHQVTVPTDPQSGQPAGQRVHKPFKFTVALNKAVPLMYNSLASGEMLSKVTLKWYRTSVEGKQEHFFSTVLTDATIVDIDCQMPHCQDPAKSDFTQLIQVSLAYRKIDWEHTVAGTSGSDDWRAPLES